MQGVSLAKRAFLHMRELLVPNIGLKIRKILTRMKYNTMEMETGQYRRQKKENGKSLKYSSVICNC